MQDGDVALILKVSTLNIYIIIINLTEIFWKKNTKLEGN